MRDKKPSVLFLSHGGGPLPLLGDRGHLEMVERLTEIAAILKRPSAIIVISAHWEEKIPTVTSGANPSLIYDYSGFPAESYEIRYPCPGDPSLAKQVQQLLIDEGIESGSDERRGFDHGLFVPLKIMYPEADVPCIQLSLVQSLDPAEHIRIGAALSRVQHDDLLIIGSGFSFHNMKAFFSPVTAESKNMNASFEHWLTDTCSDPEMDEAERAKRLENWGDAPSARYCHPREEHLLPLHVCYGVARAPCKQFFEVNIMNRLSSAYIW